MTDIAPKLRQWYVSLMAAGHEVPDLLEAADENERLRAALREIKEGEYTEETMKWIAEEALGDE